MAETENPVESLHAKELPVRAAAARDLALAGTAEHLVLLVDRAVHDISPGVRLSCAAAAADILTRYRRSGVADAIPVEVRLALFKRFSPVDPGGNAGLFQVAATLGIPAGFERVLLGLRDPRYDVRSGAVVGLWRYAVSGVVNGDERTETAVVAALGDTRVRVETRAEIARLCANVGFTRAHHAASVLAAAEAKGVATVGAEALARLDAPPPRDGFWVDLGTDAGEVAPGAVVRSTIATVGDIVVGARGGETRAHGPRRYLWIKRPGETELAFALQIGPTTWYRASPEEMLAFGDHLLAAGAWPALDRIDPILPPGAATLRLRGAALLHRGDVEGAIATLSAAMELKKVPVDTSFYLGDALVRAGRRAEGLPHLERYLARAPKKSPHLAAARAIVEGT